MATYTQQLEIFALLGLYILGMVVSESVHAKKSLGVSYPDYDRVEVQPHSVIAGTFTTFNRGDENLTCYAEIRNAPGLAFIEWMRPDKSWVRIPEIEIPIQEHRYARFTVYLKDLVQGIWYNWSIVVGYVETNPNTHAVAANGIQINMIWPLPPPEIPWYTMIPWIRISFLALELGVAGYLGFRILKGIIRYRRMPSWEEQKQMEKKHD